MRITSDEQAAIDRIKNHVGGLGYERPRDGIGKAQDAIVAELRAAVLTERERCAKIAEDCDGPAPESDADGNVRAIDPRSAIAAAIRSGEG